MKFIENKILKKGILVFFGLMVYSFTLAQDLVWLEAEKFDKLGGWTSDWQFLDQMGSSYLLASGIGSPVKDAHTNVELSRKGKYRVWVRSKNWDTTYSPGQFSLLVNEKTVQKTFGKSEIGDWTWEDGGIVSLVNQNELTIRDNTGYYGRLDAIVFSSDLNWTPPNDRLSLDNLRKKYHAISPNIEDKGEYDVVVIGGGLAGTLAAVAAAREGSKTVLIQNRDQLGGNASLEILVPPVGVVQTNLEEEYKKFDVRESGLIEEIASYGNQRYFSDGKKYPDRLLKLVQSEPNLDLFLKTHATDVIMDDEKSIKSIIAITVPNGDRLKFHGKLFLDCTGNGIIGVKAGASYMYGRESKDMFQETKALDEPDTTTLPSSLKYWYEETATSQKFVSPPWIYSFPSCEDFGPGRHPQMGMIDHQWMIELGGTDKTHGNAEGVRDDLFKLIYGIWDHVKNHCDEWKGPMENYKLVWMGHVVGVRESYRLEGDYVMSEKDITEQPLLEDRVAYGGWGLDDHPSLGFFDKERLHNHTHRGVLHSIPYRSLYSKNIDNLMMAGRDISVTHVALTGTRVMLTCGVIGQAAGTAAGMAINHEVSPRGIYQHHLSDLQQNLLKQGAYMIELPNQDPNDLALLATAEASSGLASAKEVNNGYARARLPTAFPFATFETNAWVPDATGSGPHWVELSWDQAQQFNMIHLVFQNRGDLAIKKFNIEYQREGKWILLGEIDNPEGFRRLVLPVKDTKSNKLRITLKDEKVPGGICEIRVYKESPKTLEMAQRSMNVRKTEIGEVNLPWEND